MNARTSKVVLITGASSGIGKACAEAMASRGHRVFGTSRADRPNVGPADMIRMDVTDDRSVARGIEEVARRAGRLDVVVNNAGMGYFGAIEDTSIEEAKRQFDVNFFGVLRVCRAALPLMRAQREGLILNISSIGGLVGLPFEGLYSASKFAVEGFSEALSLEVRPFGINVVLIEPGDVRTEFPKNRLRTEESGRTVAYRDSMGKVFEVIERDERRAPEPEIVGRLVSRIAEERLPSRRYRVGPFVQRFGAGLKGILPDRWFEALLRRSYGL